MKVAVVGGGPAGLATALGLRDRGHEVLLLEREARGGGKVQTVAHEGWQLDRGPSALLDNAPETRALIRRLGLDGEVVSSDAAAKRRYVVSQGRLAALPDSPPKILFSPVFSFGDRLRLLGELRTRPGTDPNETLADFATRHVGASLAERFVEPMASGVYAGDWRRLSVAAAFPRLAELDRTHGSLLRGGRALAKEAKARRRAAAQAGEVPSAPPPSSGASGLISFRRGLGQLTATLVSTLGDALRPGSDARALQRLDRGRWRLDTASGSIEADRVVLALPPGDAARLCAPLDAALADAYAAIPQASLAAVALGWPRAAVHHALDGFGLLVPRRERLRPLGTLFMTSIFPSMHQAPDGHVLLRTLIGGRTDPEVLALSDEELVEAVRAPLATLLGLEGAPALAHVVRWPEAIPQYEVGHQQHVETITARCEALGLHPTGSALFGVGVNDVIRHAAVVAAQLCTP